MPTPRKRCRVIADYESAYPDPIDLKRGDEVDIEDRESEWSGWLWCTSRQGRCGWVPEKYVQRNGDRGAAIRDYDATELSVMKGDTLTIIGEESGWFWCCDKNGRQGWVPANNVELLP